VNLHEVIEEVLKRRNDLAKLITKRKTFWDSLHEGRYATMVTVEPQWAQDEYDVQFYSALLKFLHMVD
jgi:hypothetical protein